MSVPMEGIIRPFVSRNVTPQQFTRPGAAAVPMVRIKIGFQGKIKTVSTNFSASITQKMGQVHREKSSSSTTITQTWEREE